jgi:hypothetical protein
MTNIKLFILTFFILLLFLLKETDNFLYFSSFPFSDNNILYIKRRNTNVFKLNLNPNLNVHRNLFLRLLLREHHFLTNPITSRNVCNGGVLKTLSV